MDSDQTKTVKLYRTRLKARSSTLGAQCYLKEKFKQAVFLLVTVTVKLARKILSEIKVRKLTTMKQCKVGVEIHFKKGNECSGKKKARRVRRFTCWFCQGCVAVNAK